MAEIISRNYFKWFLILIISGAVVLLICFAVVGGYTRLNSDDYCIGFQSHSMSFLEGIHFKYFVTNGRFSYAIISLLVARLPQGLYTYLPGLSILAYLSIVTVFIYRVLRQYLPSPKWISALFTTAVFTTTVFITTPNLFQVLYWKVGNLNYSFPILIFFLYLIYLFDPQKREKTSGVFVFISLLFAFAIGGFNEAFLAIQASVLIVCALITWIKEKNTLLFRMLTAGVIGSILTLIVIYVSPGVAHRRSLFPTAYSLDIFQTSISAVVLSAKFIYRTLLEYPAIVVFVGTAGIILGIKYLEENNNEMLSTKKTFLRMLFFAVVGFLLIIGTFSTGLVGLGKEIPERTKFNPQIIIILEWIVQGWLLGTLLYRSYAKTRKYLPVLIAVCFVFGTYSIAKEGLTNVRLLPSLGTYAYEWDQRDQLIRSTDEMNVRAPSLSVENSGGLNELRHFPDHWVNTCAAGYYQKESIIVCDEHYPDICIPSIISDRGDVDCDQIPERNFTVLPPDPHGLDRNNNGIGCDE